MRQLNVVLTLPLGSDDAEAREFLTALGRLTGSHGIKVTGVVHSGSSESLERAGFVPDTVTWLVLHGVDDTESLRAALGGLPGQPGSIFTDDRPGWAFHRELLRRLLTSERRRGDRSHVAEFDRVPLLQAYRLLLLHDAGSLEALQVCDVVDLMRMGLERSTIVKLQAALFRWHKFTIASLKPERVLADLLSDSVLAKLSGTSFGPNTTVADAMAVWWNGVLDDKIGQDFDRTVDFRWPLQNLWISYEDGQVVVLPRP